jgi:hypothetical protein
MGLQWGEFGDMDSPAAAAQNPSEIINANIRMVVALTWLAIASMKWAVDALCLELAARNSAAKSQF